MRHSFWVPGELSMKMRNIGLFLAVAIVAAVAVLVAAVPPEQTLAFVHVTVIDATGSPAQPDMTVIVEDRRIVQIGSSAERQRSEERVDRRGARQVSDSGPVGYARARNFWRLDS